MNSTTLAAYGAAFSIAAGNGTNAASLTWNNNATFFACPLDDSDTSFNVFTRSINDACEAIVLQIQGVPEDEGSCPTVATPVMNVESTATVSSQSKTTITLTVPFSRMSGSATGTSSAVATYRPDSAAAASVVPRVGKWMVVVVMGAPGVLALGLW